MKTFWDVSSNAYMLENLLDIKAAYWGLDSDEYREWKEYFEGLSERELTFEYNSHFGEDDE